MLNIRHHPISTIGVVDDSQRARQSRGLLLADAGLEMFDVVGPLPSVISTRQLLSPACEAVICDHHLNTNANYAHFLGAELVAHSVSKGLPAVLCTRYMVAEILDIRRHLPMIPSLLSPQELCSPEDLEIALETCIGEMEGDILPERRVWRAQVVIEDVADDGTFIAAFPGWDTGQCIRFRHVDVPKSLRDLIRIGFRTYVEANLGEERPERLFVTRWQV